MILNELSILENEKKQTDRNQNHIVSQLIKLCHKISHEKRDRDIYYTEEFMREGFSQGGVIERWLHDSGVPQQEKAFFRTIVNRRQLICEEDFLGSEFIVKTEAGEKKKAVGCLAAYEWESYVVSMDTSDLWENKEIVGNYSSLMEFDNQVCIDEKEACVENCCFEEQLHLLEEKEKHRCQLIISSGRELWEKRGILYPHLCFCDSVQEQLKEARVSLHIRMIMKRLQILEDYFSEYTGRFDRGKVGYGCRYESESVEKDNELRSMRVFRTPGGIEEFFGWHISFSGNYPGRIHFIPDMENKMGIVGYIGKHLPTAKYPTI
jgi:hypothetical protein